jgi:M6 family metalloprotease-like protein
MEVSLWWPRILAMTLLLAGPADLRSQAATATGTLTAVWGDPPARVDASPELHWFVTSDRGQVTRVEIPASLLRRAGGVHALDRRRVSLRGRVIPRPGARPGDTPALEATSLESLGPAAGGANALYVRRGSQPYAVVLCGFADIPTELRPPAFFETLMGQDHPNMGHYFGEVSAGQMDLEGTRVFGWYTLPLPWADYFDGDTGLISLARLAGDCLAKAAAVDFSPFAGVIAQFNGPFSTAGPGSAYGGSMTLTLDGDMRVWPFVWMPDWAVGPSRYGIYAHEIGHSLGLPHSSGPYDRTYDSMWDVMSNPYLRYDAGLQAWLPGQTIAFHKDRLGWIPPERKILVTGSGRAEIELEPHSRQSIGGNAPLLVEVRIPGTPDSYTLEARARSGYDAALPGEAVVMHRVPDPLGPDCTPHRCARVVDAYGNGNPNDKGAMWTAGDVFEDGSGVHVSVIAATESGWSVDVAVTAPHRPRDLTLDRAASALYGRVELTPEEVHYLDVMGNRNGRFDLGDFLAFVRREEP